LKSVTQKQTTPSKPNHSTAYQAKVQHETQNNLDRDSLDLGNSGLIATQSSIGFNAKPINRSSNNRTPKLTPDSLRQFPGFETLPVAELEEYCKTLHQFAALLVSTNL
jgi:hypothetical protein